MIKKILLSLVVVIAVFLTVVAFLPSDYRVSRTATISAPAADVFAQVNDLRQYAAWNPWSKYDPTMKSTFEGAATGTGAILSWIGNNQVGQGRMTITESRPGDFIRMQLDFLKPFESTATAEFTFKPQRDQTEITWSMQGEKVFIGKLIGVFLSMDKMIGGEFEKGLAELKARTEAAVRK